MDLGNFFPHVDEASRWLRERVKIVPRMIVVLSAGLGGFVDDMQEAEVVSSSEIPHFPKARAEGHEGKLVFGSMHGVPVVAMSGRFHLYEGHAPHEVVFPYFALANLGARMLVTTNAVGGVNKRLRTGDIMLVTDHINMMGVNPLVGIAVQRPHDQFTSMIDAYDPALQRLAKRVAKRVGIKLRQGVYLATIGPSYETKAEVGAFRKLGADAVGMSTVPEVIAAKFLNLRVVALSCIANPAADHHRGRMAHEEVLEAMAKLAPRAVRLLEGIVAEAGEN